MWERIGAVIFKEVRQMVRDPGTVSMMLVMPIIQMFIFGVAINTDPRHLPLAIEGNDHSAISRGIVSSLRQTSYFELIELPPGYGEGERMIAQGKTQFVLTIPPDFTRDVVRGQRPELLLTVDATDPSATGPAVAAVGEAVNRAIERELIGPLAPQRATPAPVNLVLHRSFNPEGITSHSTVPGLLAIILTMTMVVLTAMAVAREEEQGTMENLLATPLRPIEVMVGKIVPYFGMGLVQIVVILTAMSWFFQVPIVGSIVLLMAVSVVFALVCLALGFTISTMVHSQVMAMQSSMILMLPSILLSGFAFPYRGMPKWVQVAAEVLPTTHYVRLVRGIILKGWDLRLALPEIGSLTIMLLVLTLVAVRRYRDTVA